jgi:hypothetical protein
MINESFLLFQLENFPLFYFAIGVEIHFIFIRYIFKATSLTMVNFMIDFNFLPTLIYGVKVLHLSTLLNWLPESD